MLVFARKMDKPTATLLRAIRDNVRKHKKEQLFGYMVFIGGRNTQSEVELEKAAYAFVRKNGCTEVPVSALGDPDGPPGFLIHDEAQITVLMFRRRKIIVNIAFTAKEWNTKAVEKALADLPKLLASK